MINISIVLYKTSTIHIKNLLSSIEFCSFLNNIYIIDNSPTDELKSFFDSSKIKFIYIHNPENTGYGASHNIAIKESLNNFSEYHLVMNPTNMKLNSHYSFLDYYWLCWSLLITKIFFREARLIRQPIRIRGYKNIKIGKGFTTGQYFRIEAFK